MSEPPADDPYRTAAPSTTSWVRVYRWGIWDTLGVVALVVVMSLVALAMILGGLGVLADAVRLGAVGQGLAGIAIVGAAIMTLAMSVRFARARLGGVRRTIEGSVESKKIVKAVKNTWYIVRVDAVDYELPRDAWDRVREGVRARITFSPAKVVFEIEVLSTA